ncbi:MAG: hypothetical protein KatS3mg104_3042 [Phycisphaerae bacterium]|nr:MAG: hypothetical protein KatS3mg104_3042 [Phycisphaerae bacterium]
MAVLTIAQIINTSSVPEDMRRYAKAVLTAKYIEVASGFERAFAQSEQKRQLKSHLKRYARFWSSWGHLNDDKMPALTKRHKTIKSALGDMRLWEMTACGFPKTEKTTAWFYSLDPRDRIELCVISRNIYARKN